jgi:hypothetical protein
MVKLTAVPAAMVTIADRFIGEQGCQVGVETENREDEPDDVLERRSPLAPDILNSVQNGYSAVVSMT